MAYKIHPAIGIARVGNSEEYYIAPEQAGALPILPDGRPFTPADFRDASKRLRRQGARFEVYLYDDTRPDDPGTPVRAGENGVKGVEWTVHLANKKPIWYQFIVNSGENGYPPDHPLRNPDVQDRKQREQLMIDPGPRTVAGPNQSVDFSRFDNPSNYPMTFPPEDLEPHAINSIGGLRTDDVGRLIVVGGYGRSGSSSRPPLIFDYANNDAWWDDTSDGPVTARVVMQDGSAIEVEASAWVLVAPPRFAPELVNLVSLYDTMLDVAIRHMGLRPDVYQDGLWNDAYRPSWEQEILPLLERGHHYQWVVAIPPHPHDFDFDRLGDPNPEFNRLRAYYLQNIRPPNGQNLYTSPETGYPMMPFLCGDNCFEPGPLGSSYLSVTDTQYFFLQQWAAGTFTVGQPRPIGPGQALDIAALENCVGGAFSPGIEMTWISRNPLIYAEPFRIRRKPNVQPPLSLGQSFADGLEPGDLTKYMALPWQADFNECSQEQIGDRFVWWWPVQRPDFVYIHHHQHPERLRQVPWVGTDQDQNASNYIEFTDDLDMVKLWHDLGFVFNEGTPEKPQFVEVERLLSRHRTPTGALVDAPPPA